GSAREVVMVLLGRAVLFAEPAADSDRELLRVLPQAGFSPDRRPPTLCFPCRVRVTICGRLRIESDAAVIDESSLPGRLGRKLWAFLVLTRRRPVGRGVCDIALLGFYVLESII